MGMSVRTVDELVEMQRQRRFRDLQAVCDIGATELHLKGDKSAVERFLKAFGGPGANNPFDIERWAYMGYAAELWRACGLDYLAIDTSTEIPALNLDLNFDPVPDEHRGRYQLVLNIGTTEHICNQLNALKAIHDLCAPGGWMYHVLPISGYQNHGFFRYNPKLFWSLCRSNDYGYADLRVDVVKEIEPLHQDIAEHITGFGHDPDEFAHYATAQGVLRVLLQKRAATHFRPPFDGVSGQTPNEIPERYDDVFRSEVRRDEAEEAASGPHWLEAIRNRFRMLGKKR